MSVPPSPQDRANQLAKVAGKTPDVIGRQPTAQEKVETIRDYLDRYKLRVLVETGLYNGWGSGMAPELADVAYFCIDHQAGNIEQARKNRPDGSYVCGDSATELPALLPALRERALFWLDAHGIPGDIGFPPCPLLDELSAVAHWSRPSVVLIDDVRLLGHHDWPSLEHLRGYVDALGRWDRLEADDIMRLTPRA